MPTPYSVDGSFDRVGPRMDVAARGSAAAMAGEIGERLRVHEGGPARQAGVAERVKRERFHLRGGEHLLVLLLQRGLLDLAGGRRRGEHSF